LKSFADDTSHGVICGPKNPILQKKLDVCEFLLHESRIRQPAEKQHGIRIAQSEANVTSATVNPSCLARTIISI